MKFNHLRFLSFSTAKNANNIAEFVTREMFVTEIAISYPTGMAQREGFLVRVLLPNFLFPIFSQAGRSLQYN